MTRKIIAFAGRAGSGKNYQCALLEKNSGFKVMAFADALRKIMFVTLGISYEYGMQHYDELKKTPLFNGQTLRDMLQHLGTEGIRKYDNDFWCKCLIKDINDLPETQDVCVSDLRFYNEYEYLKNYADEHGYEFELRFCDYHSDRYIENSFHASERLANFLCDVGYKDGQVVRDEDMTIYINNMRGLVTP